MESISAKQGYLKVLSYFVFITFYGAWWIYKGGKNYWMELSEFTCITFSKKVRWLICNHSYSVWIGSCRLAVVYLV